MYVKRRSVWSTCWTLCGNQISGAPRHRRDVSVAASARWRGEIPRHRRDVDSIPAQARPRGGLVWGQRAHIKGVGDVCGKYEEARGLRVLEKSFNRLRLGRGLIQRKSRGEGHPLEAQGPFLEGARVFVDVGAAAGLL